MRDLVAFPDRPYCSIVPLGGAPPEAPLILGLGIDLVEIERFSAAIERHGSRFIRRLFTEGERASCEARADGIQSFAARFAAKEAAMKALGSGWADGVGFLQFEILRAENGKPSLKLSSRAKEIADALGVERAHVSLTHQPGSAAAVVILER